MKMTVNDTSNNQAIVGVKALEIGDFAIGVTEFTGELFYRTGDDIIGLDQNRRWSGVYDGGYVPKFLVRKVQPGETVTLTRVK